MNRNIKDTIVESLTGVCVLVIIFIIVSILTITIVGGWPNLNWTFLSEFPKDGMTKGGIFPAIVGTAVMTIIMAVAAVPFGVITAIYLAEYANEKSVYSQDNTFCCKNSCCCSFNYIWPIWSWFFYWICRKEYGYHI